MPAPTATTRDLIALYIPDAVPIPWNEPNSALSGVGMAAIANDLFVYVEAYSGMAVGDIIEVFWDDSEVSFASVVVTQDELNQRLGLKLPEERFRAGDFEPFYKLLRVSSTQEEFFSESRAVRVKLDLPGGIDPLPNTPNTNENLAAPLVPEDIALNGVGPTEAAQGVDVSVVTYLNQAPYDRINLSWGGQIQTYTLDATAVGQTVVIHINEAQILAAGDGEITLMYQVFDAASNRSMGWSLATTVKVRASDDVLDPPIVEEASQSVLELSTLDGQSATIQIVTSAPDFNSGDQLQVSWEGHNENLILVPWSDTRVLSEVPKVEEFSVPYDTVAAIANGYAVVTYTLKKQGSETLLFSASTQIQVVGEVLLLSPPVVLEAENGQLTASLSSATVEIQPYLGMAAGDTVNLIWQGLKQNNQPTDYRDTLFVSGSGAGQVQRFIVPGSEISVLDGGSVTLYYSVESSANGGTEESAPLTLTVGSVASSLPAPQVREAIDGVLPADVLMATVEIQPYTSMSEGDRLDLLWNTDNTGNYSDWLPISASMVGKIVNFHVDNSQIASNTLAQTSYTLTRTNNTSESSAWLYLQIGTAKLLAPPVVEQAVNGVLALSSVPNGASVRIEVYSAMAAGDTLQLTWSGDGGIWQDSLSVTAGSAGQAQLFVVPQAEVAKQVGSEVQVSYQVERYDGPAGESEVLELRVVAETNTLPLPIVDEAQGDEINPADVLNGATVRIDKSAAWQVDDQVQVHWRGPNEAASTEVSHALGSAELNQDLLLTIPYSVVVAGDGGSVSLDYSIQRTSSSQTSNTATYRINSSLSNGSLLVMGGRSATSYRNGPLVHRQKLIALDAQSREPISANWQYQDEEQVVTGSLFRDTQPNKLLRVFTSEDTVVLNRSNVIGNGANLYSAMAVLLDSGRVVSWGYKYMGGVASTQAIALKDVLSLSAVHDGFIAQRANGAICFWGDDDSDLPLHIAALTDVQLSVASGDYVTGACAGLRSSGQVFAWSKTAYGGELTPEAAIADDIYQVVGGYNRFIALRRDGSAISWGQGYEMPEAVAALTDVTSAACSLYDSYCLLRSNGRVAAWGVSGYGGKVPDEIQILNDIVEITPNGFGFAALRANGRVATWGDSSSGGKLPNAIALLDDIVSVSATEYAYCALRSNGSVVAWGYSSYGGEIPDAIKYLNDIVQVTGNVYAFAALRSNGTVVTWGDKKYGGDSSDVQLLLRNVRGIYAGGYSFAALCDDRRLITWGRDSGGEESSGGNSSGVIHLINGNISYEVQPQLLNKSN
ncbi:RCC1 domain-containing protein [Pseudomonas sp. 5P_3.1_Bac2]|uniref:RCC1 domain-containing protein n=1 Tax=Pseudomonas sp. 5P_3.1_Bac2 TaxID=2971617 RepID=UPI0021C62C6A|nr:hypothetical protein [Pseudomonas sp. 5P_3.1_Bac2]MCU1719010.1 hypothetical protein [Pseudomonas sp. 5P_3.1_Bac2]